MPATSWPAWRRSLLVAVLAMAASGCWVTQTEVLGARDSIKLAGNRVTMRDANGSETVYIWNEQRAGYLDADASGLLRIARLKGDVFIGQYEILKSREPATLPPGQRAFAVMALKLAPPRLVVQAPSCAKYRDNIIPLARPYGVTIDPRREFAISGTREAILGFMAATLACRPETIEAVELTADAITPGGTDLAAAGNAADATRTVEAFERRCNAGELQVCFRVAQILWRGEGVPADPARAASLLEKVCADPKGNAEACVDLAQLHDRGEGVRRDPARATELLKKACAAGEMYGCDLLKRRPPP